MVETVFHGELRRHRESPDLGPTSSVLFPLLQFKFPPKIQFLGKAASFLIPLSATIETMVCSVATSRMTSRIKLKVTWVPVQGGV